MTKDLRRSRWFILLWWLLSGVVGYSMGFPVGLALGDSVVWGWGIGGTLAALGQWYILLGHIPRAVWWVAASLAGLSLGVGLGYLLSEPVLLLVGLTASYAWVGGTVGLGAGAAQWILLRRHLRWAAWWVPGSVAGYTLGVLAAINAPVAVPGPVALAFGAQFGGPVGLVSATVTGLMLVWLLALGADSDSQRL
jgi:hypothetical protein